METMSRGLRRLRAKTGLTSSAIAQRTGVSPSTYRAREAGRSIRGEPYISLAKALQVPLSQLMLGEILEEHEERKLLSTFDRLKREVRELEETLISLR